MEKDKERMLELLADQTLFGLSAEETAELKRLKDNFPEFEDDNSLEMAAAAINLINLNIEDSVPPSLLAKLESQAAEFLGTPTKTRELASFEMNQPAELPQNVFARSIEEFAPKPSIWQWLGWAVAATACVALALNLWMTRFQPKTEIARNPETVKTPETIKTPETLKTLTPELTAAQAREQLLTSAPDVIQTSWTSPKDKQKVLGDIVWSNSKQKGYIRLHGLPVTKPNEETYQLWIVDGARTEKNPLSGGVFAINETGEVIVPIDAQLNVNEPKVFAITKEKPGGVVVSKPERMVAVAKV